MLSQQALKDFRQDRGDGKRTIVFWATQVLYIGRCSLCLLFYSVPWMRRSWSFSMGVPLLQRRLTRGEEILSWCSHLPKEARWGSGEARGHCSSLHGFLRPDHSLKLREEWPGADWDIFFFLLMNGNTKQAFYGFSI